jgi:hypothetical protein
MDMVACLFFKSGRPVQNSKTWKFVKTNVSFIRQLSEKTMAEMNGIEVGSFFLLKGLEKVPYLNGRVGIVMTEQDQRTQRFQVKLLEPWKDPRTGNGKDDELAFKPQISN